MRGRDFTLACSTAATASPHCESCVCSAVAKCEKVRARKTAFSGLFACLVGERGWHGEAQYKQSLVLLRGENRQFAVAKIRYFGRKGGELSTTGGQLYSGYGAATPSVSAVFYLELNKE